MALDSLHIKVAYNKAYDNIAEDFYLPCMESSIAYDRISGYFSSTIYILAWRALKIFITNSGKIRLICSPYLSEEDTKALDEGYNAKEYEVLYESLKNEVDILLQKNEIDAPNRLLACLVGMGIVDIKIAIGRSKTNPEISRLFHDKVGLFTDISNNTVGFRGSVNETFKGLSDDGNLESIDVFPNWKNESDNQRVILARQYFDELWENQIQGIRVYDFPETLKEQIRVSTKDAHWKDLLKEITVQMDKSKFWAAEKGVNGRRPREHQVNALEAWQKNKRRGIFEHATGSGKTFTAICAIRQSLEKEEIPIILVPSTDLLKQWEKELKDTFLDDDVNYLLCGDGNNSWRTNNKLSNWTKNGKDFKRIVIATLDTAATDNFISSICGGEHIFIVADEVHRTGSSNRRKIFEINSGPRLGLSATPKRYGDPEGTQAIFNYFGPVIPPPFTLKDAIDSKVLTPYFYHPLTVNLNYEEQEKWEEITIKINKKIAIRENFSKSLNPISNQSLNLLLQARARIIKNAIAKIEFAIKFIVNNYKSGQRWIIYCDNKSQLSEILQGLLANKINAYAYYCDMEGDRKETLRYFSKLGGVIVSIKCLDEGVDIPSMSHALIIASSKNPREFIQRRGRILRKYAGKHFSYLYDVLVLPQKVISSDSGNSTIVEAELSRAIQFGEWSEDLSCITNLKNIAIEYKIDYNKLIEEGVEYGE